MENLASGNLLDCLVRQPRCCRDAVNMCNR